MGLEATSLESRCQEGWFLLRALRKDLFQISLQASSIHEQSWVFLNVEASG